VTPTEVLVREESVDPDGAPLPIGEVRWRQAVVVRGQIRSMRVRPWGDGVSTLEATLVDDTGGVTLVFLGRHHIAGLALGRRLEAEGMVGENRERLVILNPIYRLLPDEAPRP
jgi:hypothetical protein